jgi:hypothetical protein
MIDPTEKDVGRRVVYTSNHGVKEHGVITSVRVLSIFVRYDGETQSKATAPADMEWENTTDD